MSVMAAIQIGTALAGLGIHAFSKPKYKRPDLSYVDRYINNLRGDLASRSVERNILRQGVRTIGDQSRDALRQNEYSNYQQGLAGSGLDIARRQQILQSQHQATAQLGSQAAIQASQAAEGIRHATAEATMQKEMALSQARQQYQEAKSQWKRGFLSQGLNLLSSTATTMAQGHQEQQIAQKDYYDRLAKFGQVAGMYPDFQIPIGREEDGSQIYSEVTPEVLMNSFASEKDARTFLEGLKNKETAMREGQAIEDYYNTGDKDAFAEALLDIHNTSPGTAYSIMERTMRQKLATGEAESAIMMNEAYGKGGLTMKDTERVQDIEAKNTFSEIFGDILNNQDIEYSDIIDFVGQKGATEKQVESLKKAVSEGKANRLIGKIIDGKAGTREVSTMIGSGYLLGSDVTRVLSAMKTSTESVLKSQYDKVSAKTDTAKFISRLNLAMENVRENTRALNKPVHPLAKEPEEGAKDTKETRRAKQLWDDYRVDMLEYNIRLSEHEEASKGIYDAILTAIEAKDQNKAIAAIDSLVNNMKLDKIDPFLSFLASVKNTTFELEDFTLEQKKDMFKSGMYDLLNKVLQSDSSDILPLIDTLRVR